MGNKDFLDHLSEFGILVDDETRLKTRNVIISHFFGNDIVQMSKNGCRYSDVDSSVHTCLTAFQSTIKKAIDLDEWKHSYHHDITDENFPIFSDIIKKKILQRVEDLDFLLFVYLLLEKNIN